MADSNSINTVAVTAAASDSALLAIPDLWRLVGILVAGVMAREILMDCADVNHDRSVGIQTVPVVHGTQHASRVALAFIICMSLLVVTAPLLDILSEVTSDSSSWLEEHSSLSETWSLITIVTTSSAGRRLALAGFASLWQVSRYFQICRAQGRDVAAIDKALEEGTYCLLMLLASMVA